MAIPPTASLAGLPIYLQAMVEGRDAQGVPELRLTNAIGQTIQP